MDEVEFGRYRLLSLLGEGGMGEVWRAHDTVTDRVVAIKLLPPKLSKDEEFQQRFRREAHAAARLETPHVVPIHDYGEIDGRLFVCMRLINGRDLATVLTDGPLEPARAARIIGQVAEALHAAHEIGLIHRDIKPSNILLDDRDFAYLIDFGIARIAEDTRMTKTGNTIGTFAYIAPERLDGRGDEDARVDIYSLACVLYECLSGEPPFGGDTMARLVAAHLNTPPPRPSIGRPDVPAQVDEVIATGMAKDPDQRYATTVELADAAHDAITAPTALPAQKRATRAAFVTPAGPTMGPAAEAPAQQPDIELNLAQATADHPPNETSTPPRKSWWPPRDRSILIATIIAAVVVLAAGILIFRPQQPSRAPTHSAVSTTQPAPPPPPPPPKPVVEAQLEGLLLSVDQINAAVGATGITAFGTDTAMADDSVLPTLSDRACLPLQTPVAASVYADSGWSAVRMQGLRDDNANTHLVAQAVVSFSSAMKAGAFYTESTQSWLACANRQLTVADRGNPSSGIWAVGPVSNTNGILSTTKTLVSNNGTPSDGRRTCQRALTVANNVAIDILACSFGLPAGAVINIAQQIAAKVPRA
jgi:serine/threonine kinase PknH